MKWKKKPEYNKPPDPEIDTIRWLEKYAWLPITTMEGYRVWLEKYWVKQKYKRFRRSIPETRSFYWKDKWVTLERWLTRQYDIDPNIPVGNNSLRFIKGGLNE